MKAAVRRVWSPRGGLFSKYVISFVGLVVFVLAMNGAVEVWIIYRETSSSLVRAQSEKADAIARRIEQFIQEAERQISWATRASVTTVEQRRADYAVLLQQVPAIDELTQLDGNGREQLKLTRRGATLGSNADFSREPKFTETVARRSWYGPVYFRGIDPYMTIALAHSGRNAGVTVAEIDLRSLAEFVGESEMSKASYAYVTGPQGRLLAHTDMALLGRGTETPGLPQVAAVRNAGGEPSMTGTDLDGRSVLTASVQIPRLNWHVFVEQPLSQAFAPIYNLLKRLGWLLALGLSVAFLAALLLARRMVVPIRALQAGARELGDSDFGHRITVRSGDEIEELADQFNRMAEKLKESYSAPGAESRGTHPRSRPIGARAEGAGRDRPRRHVVARSESRAGDDRDPRGRIDPGRRRRDLLLRHRHPHLRAGRSARHAAGLHRRDPRDAHRRGRRQRDARQRARKRARPGRAQARADLDPRPVADAELSAARPDPRGRVQLGAGRAAGRPRRGDWARWCCSARRPAISRPTPSA